MTSNTNSDIWYITNRTHRLQQSPLAQTSTKLNCTDFNKTQLHRLHDIVTNCMDIYSPNGTKMTTEKECRPTIKDGIHTNF